MMAWTEWQGLWGGAAPVLPAPGGLALVRQLGWALVLAAIVWRGWFGLVWLPPRGRAALAVLLALAALWPGPWGLAYWLGLAFQVPSLASLGLALAVLWPRGKPALVLGGKLALGLSLAAVALGWLLLLDTLALLPVFVYPWGYGSPALAGLLLVALLLSAWPASRPAGLAALVLALVFVLTRWPSGNLWDALLDPWLWLLAHGLLLRGLWRRLRRSPRP